MSAAVHLADTIESELGPYVGEQYRRWIDSDGDHRFAVNLGGVTVSLYVETWGRDSSVVMASHVIGTRIENQDAAVEFCNTRNQTLRFGKLIHTDECVIFLHGLTAPAVNRESLRDLLLLTAGASSEYPTLAEQTGALRLSDIAGIADLDEM